MWYVSDNAQQKNEAGKMVRKFSVMLQFSLGRPEKAFIEKVIFE